MASSTCTQGYTYARWVADQAEFGDYDHKGFADTDEKGLVFQAWGGVYENGMTGDSSDCFQEFGDTPFGFGSATAGKSFIHGTGTEPFGFVTSNRGFKEFPRMCMNAWRCENVGQVVLLRNIEHVIESPNGVQPEWLGLSDVSIPRGSSTDLTGILYTAVAAFATWYTANPYVGMGIKSLEYVVPLKIKIKTTNWSETEATPKGFEGFPSKPGGGIRINGPVSNDNNVVMGRNLWKFHSTGYTSIAVHNSASVDAMFRSCVGCGLVEHDISMYTQDYHLFQVDT